MVYMTFKIKRDWLFYVLLAFSAIANILSILLLVKGLNGPDGSIGALISFSAAMLLVFTTINGYAVWNIIKHYKIGLTKDSIRITDFSRVEIPYNTIRSIKKEREPSKYGLYDALLVIKYNKFDTIKLNVHDLENVFDNLKEMVQKANLDKVVNSVVTKKDGSREIQQNIPTAGGTADGMAGATVIIPAANTPTGQVIVNPNATTATVVRPSNQQSAGPMVRPAQQRPIQANAGPMVRPMTQQSAGPMVRPANTTTQQAVRTAPMQNNNKQVVRTSAGPMVRPANTMTQQAVRTTTVQPAQQTVAARTTTTTTTTTRTGAQASTPGTQQSTVINPDGSKRIITTTTTVKPTE